MPTVQVAKQHHCASRQAQHHGDQTVLTMQIVSVMCSTMLRDTPRFRRTTVTLEVGWTKAVHVLSVSHAALGRKEHQGPRD